MDSARTHALEALFKTSIGPFGRLKTGRGGDFTIYNKPRGIPQFETKYMLLIVQH